jgi:hypothetical protein
MSSEELQLMQARASLFKKKLAVMAALEGGMAKRGKNDHFDYKFVTASDIKRTVSALFAAHGLSLQMSGVATDNVTTMIEVKDYQTKSTRMKEVPILRVQFSICLCDIDTGAIEQSYWFGEAGASDDKAASKAATSALKYFLISNLLIADADEDKRDTDRDEGKKKPAPRDAQQSPAPVEYLHWSDEPGALDKMYGWALKSHKVDQAGVNALIAKTGKAITQLSKEAVMSLIAPAK